jgi:integrase
MSSKNDIPAVLPLLSPLSAVLPVLESSSLSEMAARAVDELMREGESANTVASYRSGLRYWAAWFGIRFGQPIALPVHASAVLQFVVDHVQRSTGAGLVHELPAAMDEVLVVAGFKGKPGPMALNTLVHRLAVLSKAHQQRGLTNPCQDPRVRELMGKTRRAYGKRGGTVQKKDALTRELLQQLLATCDDSLRGQRDRALLLFAWASGGRRRSEVAGADMQYLRRVGARDFIYTLGHSKTNQSGADLPENHKPVSGQAADALQAWLMAAGIVQGPIFRAIRKGGHLGPPLSPAAVRTIVKERCALAGVEGDFSAHSLRSGFVTEAGRQNVSLSDTMALTGHSNVNTVMGYFRADTVLQNRAARLLDREGPEL